MSMRESRFSIRATSFGSVSPRWSRPSHSSASAARRSCSQAAAPACADAAGQGPLIRIVSVNASFAPLTVFSCSPARRAAPRPALGLEAERLGQPGKTTTQYPCVSLSAAASAESASSHTAHQTAPRCASHIIPPAFRAGGFPSAVGRQSRKCAAGRHAVEKQRIEHLPARRQLPQAKNRPPR